MKYGFPLARLPKRHRRNRLLWKRGQALLSSIRMLPCSTPSRLIELRPERSKYNRRVRDEHLLTSSNGEVLPIRQAARRRGKSIGPICVAQFRQAAVLSELTHLELLKMSNKSSRLPSSNPVHYENNYINPISQPHKMCE